MPAAGFRKQFCKIGHDTFICGRKGGWCMLCLKARVKDSVKAKEINQICKWKRIGCRNSDGSFFVRKDYEKFYSKQKGKCAICKRHEKTLKRRLSVDHCHKTGIVRGLLCSACNLFLSGIENKKFHRKALVYLKRFHSLYGKR